MPDRQAGELPVSVVAVVPGRANAHSTIQWAAQEATLRQGRLLVVDAPFLDERAAIAAGEARPERPLDGDWLTRETAGAAAPVAVETVGVRGSAAALAIRRIGRATHAPVVAIGSVSRSVLSALVFGPQRHERQPPDPATVVVVPPPGRVGAGGPVAVGFHGTQGSASALRWAVEEAARRGAPLIAVMAWSEQELDQVAGCIRVDPRLYALPGRDATRIMGAALEQSRVSFEVMTPVVRRGTPAQVLLRESRRSELLVVGAGDLLVHGYRVLGPVAGACATRSAVPVAIVPHV